MIALNEIIDNKQWFYEKYELAGKRVNLEKIVFLEQKLLRLNKSISELRANCNKLCSQVADEINLGNDSSNLIKHINALDLKISSLEKKSERILKKINRQLSKLPNLPIDENTLNIAIPTHQNPSYTKNDFIRDISKICKIQKSNSNFKKCIKSMQNVVIKNENLPQIFQLNKKQNEILILSNSQSLDIYNSVVELLKQNSKFLFNKSIKYLNYQSSKEFVAIFCDNFKVEASFLGEYVSRNIGLKFYDKKLDMTKFVNMIRIKVC